jgi:hypothetical protein
MIFPGFVLGILMPSLLNVINWEAVLLIALLAIVLALS